MWGEEVSSRAGSVTLAPSRVQQQLIYGKHNDTSAKQDIGTIRISTYLRAPSSPGRWPSQSDLCFERGFRVTTRSQPTSQKTIA